MAKYVCEFGSVISAGQSLIQAASDLTSATNNYSSKINSDLSGWEGTAKSSFMTQCTTQTEAALKKAQEIVRQKGYKIVVKFIVYSIVKNKMVL